MELLSTSRWTARLLAALFALFLILFACIEIFGLGQGAVELIMHLIPAVIVIGLLALAWKFPLFGGIGYIGLGLWYIISSWNTFPFSTLLLVGGPVLMSGVLFLAEAYLKKQGA